MDKDVVHIYAIECCSVTKSTEILPLWQQGWPSDYHTKSGREGQAPRVVTYMQNQYDIDKYIYETKTDLQIQRTGFWLPRGDG